MWRMGLTIYNQRPPRHTQITNNRFAFWMLIFASAACAALYLISHL